MRECVCLTDHTVLELLVSDRENSTRWRNVWWNKMTYKQYQTEMTTINDLLTFLRRFRGHVYFRFSGAGWACEDYRLFKSQATQTPLKFYPEFPLFIRSICVSKSARSSQILMLAFAWFWSSISWFLTKIQMSQKQVNTDAVLYTLWFHIQGNLLAYGCYEWRHAKLIYACHFYTIF